MKTLFLEFLRQRAFFSIDECHHLTLYNSFSVSTLHRVSHSPQPPTLMTPIIYFLSFIAANMLTICNFSCL